MQSSLPMFRDFIPEKIRLWIILMFPFIFQASNPLYMNIAPHIMSDTALTNEDVMMCGFACILGITVTFPILFRLKFRFTTKQILIIVSSGLILCNLLALHCHFMPLLILISFIFGIFKVWGTFECMSSAMKKISPKMDLAPFLTVVFIAVFSGVELGGLFSTHISHYYSWQYVSYFVIGLHLFIILCALTLMKDFRFQPIMRLIGIDWLGMILWSITLLSSTFVCIYGEYLNWFSSPYIYIAIGIGISSLGINIHRLLHIHHPYIEAQCFRYKNIWNILAVFLISGILLSSQNVMQNIMTHSILHYDEFTTVRLNWIVLAGIIVGAIFSKWGLTYLGWSYKQLTFVSILFVTLYLANLYYLISFNTSLEAFYLPSFFNGVGHVIIFVVLTTYVESNTPFNHRFQMLAVLGLIRTGIATPLGNAIFGRLFKVEMSKNLALIGSDIHPSSLWQYSYQIVADRVVEQSMIASIKTLLSYAVILGIISLLIILVSRFSRKYKRGITMILKG